MGVGGGGGGGRGRVGDLCWTWVGTVQTRHFWEMTKYKPPFPDIILEGPKVCIISLNR